MIRAHGLSEIDGPRRGIHLLFCGPPAWLYAPEGWRIERRLWRRKRSDSRCIVLEGPLLAELRRERELATAIGVATLGDGDWELMHPWSNETADVLTLDLTTATGSVRIAVESATWMAFGMFGGKVVAALPLQGEAVQHTLSANAIDRVVIHAVHPKRVEVCAEVAGAASAAGWVEIARLQLPVREVDGSLTDRPAEFAAAKARLIDGDALGEEEFGELADAVRALRAERPTRPIDWSVRADPENPDSAMGALDALRLAMLDPGLRRAVGLAHFDDDPTLVEGEVYEYRVRAAFPADADIPRAGFACVPIGAMVPADFFFGDIQVRLARPSRVEFVPARNVGDMVVGRRGIAVGGGDPSWWQLPDLLGAALVLDFAVPQTNLGFEAVEADLRFVAFDANGAEIGLDVVALQEGFALGFAAPCSRLVVKGKGRWLGLTGPAANMVDQFTDTAPIAFASSALPPPPLWISARSTNAVASTHTRPRSELGFDVSWQPPAAFGVAVWPPGAGTGPPLACARFEIEHAVAGEAFTNVFRERAAAYGQRGDGTTAQLHPGGDAMAIFAEAPAAPLSSSSFVIRDQFERVPPASPPAPGTMHVYRVRSIDEIGRPGDWIESSAVRLEKRAPPPVPIGPPVAPGTEGRAGVQARTLVRGASDLTDADIALLDQAGAETAIVLRWGWSAQERELDPWAREFRVYVGNGGIGAVPGRVTAVTDLGSGRFDVALALMRPVPADAAKGSYLPSGNEYRILAHGAGTTIGAIVETRLPLPDGSFVPPALGATILPLAWTPAQSRANAWDVRVASVPITDAEGYSFILYDRLIPSAGAPRASLWVGVSAADDQGYIPDIRPGEGLVGNESPVAAVRCEALYQGRPDLSVPPPIGEVPVVTTGRSTASGIRHEVDLLPFLGGALAAGEPVVVERIDEGALLAALRADGSDLVGLAPGSGPRDAAEVPILIPNPGDRAAILDALFKPFGAMADRHLVWLAARHPYADWLFVPEPGTGLLGGPIPLKLPSGGARYILRVRRVDEAGHRSAGSATCAFVLKVPALAPLAPPIYRGAGWNVAADGPKLEWTASVPDGRATHLLTWIEAIDPRGAALATIGSRRDLPGFGVRLRSIDGGALVPETIALDPGEGGPAGDARSVTVSRELGQGPHFLWLAAVDGDGVPSSLVGGYRLPPGPA